MFPFSVHSACFLFFSQDKLKKAKKELEEVEKKGDPAEIKRVRRMWNLFLIHFIIIIVVCSLPISFVGWAITSAIFFSDITKIHFAFFLLSFSSSFLAHQVQNLLVLFDSLQLAHKCILNSFYGYVMRKVRHRLSARKTERRRKRERER